MKLAAFQTLEAVLREGSFAAAADHMHLSPSAVSMQMKQLEHYLGQPLFDRSGLHVRPTPFAIEVAQAMRPALQTLAALRQRRPPATDLRGQLRIGVIDGLQPALLPPLMGWLLERHPKLQLAPRRGASVELTDAVMAGQLQAAVVARPEKPQAGKLTWHVVAQRPLRLLIPPGESVGQLRDLMQRLNWVRYSRHTTTGRLAAQIVHRYVPDKRSIVELDTISAVAGMVSAGHGFSVAHVLDDTLPARYPMQCLPLGRNVPTFDIALVHRKGDEDDRAIDVLLQAVRRTLR